MQSEGPPSKLPWGTGYPKLHKKLLLTEGRTARTVTQHTDANNRVVHFAMAPLERCSRRQNFPQARQRCDLDTDALLNDGQVDDEGQRQVREGLGASVQEVLAPANEDLQL